MSVRTRLPRLRAAYLRRPSRDTLRAYLRAKAILGSFDDRMFDYYDVPHVDNAAVRRAVRRGYAAGLVVTSTTNGRHAPGSYHYLGDAVDQGLIPGEIGTAKGRRRLVRFQRAEIARWRRGRLTRLLELIGPDNEAVILRGGETDLVDGTPLENEHDNHVHEAYGEV